MIKTVFQVVRHEAIKTHLRETLLDLILKERRGEMIDRPAFKNACKVKPFFLF
jgi:cullin 3